LGFPVIILICMALSWTGVNGVQGAQLDYPCHTSVVVVAVFLVF